MINKGILNEDVPKMFFWGIFLYIFGNTERCRIGYHKKGEE